MVSPFNCDIFVIPLSLKNFWIFVLKQQDLKNLFLSKSIPLSLYSPIKDISIKDCPSHMELEIFMFFSSVVNQPSSPRSVQTASS